MTQGYAHAKSVSGIPESRVAHAKCARAVASTSKMLSVIGLVETHRWAGWIHLILFVHRPLNIFRGLLHNLEKGLMGMVPFVLGA